jgi:hypothetical protein
LVAIQNSMSLNLSSNTSLNPAGPRSVKRHQNYLQEAGKEVALQEESKLESTRQLGHIPYETTAKAAQNNTKDFLPSAIDKGYAMAKHVSSLDIKKEVSAVYQDPSVTVWSYSVKHDKAPHFSMSHMRDTSRPFDKSSAFTNDVKDSRFTHSDATDTFISYTQL